MRVGLWILVAVATIGVALYANELHRQQLERRAMAQAYLDSVKKAQAEAAEAAKLEKARQETDTILRSAVRDAERYCDGKYGAQADKKMCKYAKALHWECVTVLNDYLKKGIVPDEPCYITMAYPGHSMSMNIQ